MSIGSINCIICTDDGGRPAQSVITLIGQTKCISTLFDFHRFAGCLRLRILSVLRFEKNEHEECKASGLAFNLPSNHTMHFDFQTMKTTLCLMRCGWPSVCLGRVGKPTECHRRMRGQRNVSIIMRVRMCAARTHIIQRLQAAMVVV